MESLDKKGRNKILLVLFIGVLMGALDIAIVGPALPSIQSSFGVDDRAITWVFTSYVLFNLIGTPLMAKLSDAFGRRSIYVLDVLTFAGGSLAVALSPTFSALLVGRAVQGFGAGGIFPVASAVIGDTFPPEKRGGALGLIGAVFGLAFLIGPLIGGILLMWGWNWLFLVNLPIALIVIIMSLRTLPTTRPAERPPFDWAGMAVLSVLLASLAYGLNQIDTAHFARSIVSMGVLPFLLLAIALIFVFNWLEERAVNPVLHLDLFRTRQISLAAALAAGAGLGEAAMVFVPALLVASFSVTSSQASFMLLPIVLAMAAGSPLAGRMLDRMGSKVVILAGTSLLTLGMAFLSFFSSNLVMFYVAAVLIGIGLSALLGAPLRYIVLNESPESQRGVAQGAITLFTSVGQLTSAAFVGAVAASQGGGVGGYQAAFLVVAGVSLILIVIALELKNRTAEIATAQQHASTPMLASAEGGE